MYQSQKSNFYHHFYSQFAVLIKNPRENVTFEWYGIVFRRWVLADSSKSGMYLNLWKRENITSNLLYHSNLGYRKWHQSSRKWSKNGKKIPENCHFSTLWPQSHLGHYFFQYFSLAKPSNWFLVDKKREKMLSSTQRGGRGEISIASDSTRDRSSTAKVQSAICVTCRYLFVFILWRKSLSKNIQILHFARAESSDHLHLLTCVFSCPSELYFFIRLESDHFLAWSVTN